MTQFVGRSGADGIFKAVDRICKIDRKYHAKMVAAIQLAEAALLISVTDAGAAINLLNNIQSFCDTFHAVADNSGFPP
jgi:hypothetical protein